MSFSKIPLTFEKLIGLNSIRTFEDSVTFDGIIDSSSVNLQDISYFAPALKGMYQNVQLSAGLHQKVKNLKISDIDLRTGKGRNRGTLSEGTKKGCRLQP